MTDARRQPGARRVPGDHAADADVESRTLRALLEMRELLVQGAFEPGERIREVPLAARLRISRTPLRLVLDRLAQEGLLRARPTRGFVASEFTIADVRDSIELRGVLEGTAARMAAERLDGPDTLAPLRACADRIDDLLRPPAFGIESLSEYIQRNAEFHGRLIDLANSPMLRRSMQQVLTLPFASPNAFVLREVQTPRWREVLLVAQSQHRALLDAIAHREGARAEALAREHSRLARTNLETAMRDHHVARIPGAALIRFPDAV